jgi:hypothetical protein
MRKKRKRKSDFPFHPMAVATGTSSMEEKTAVAVGTAMPAGSAEEDSA